MAATVGGYFTEIGTGTVTWHTVQGTSDRQWLIVVNAVAGGLISDMGTTDPGDDNDWPRGSWQLLTQVDAGDGLPKIRVWAVRFVDQVVRSFVLPSSGSVDNHSHLYFIGGQRAGHRAEQVFSVGAVSSADSATSQELPLYAPDASGLLIGAWISGGLVDYSSLGTLTARTELDGDASTTRTGEETLTVQGSATRTATASAAEAWAAVSIVARDAGGSVAFPTSKLKGRTELALGANPDADPATWAGLWTDITTDVNMRDKIAITRGRGDEASTSQPSTMGLILNNTSGKYVRLNPTGPHFGTLAKNTPIREWVDPGTGMDVRYTGQVSEWPPRSQGGQVDEHMPIQAAGITRRLAQGKVLRSPLYQSVISTLTFDAYWPLEVDASSGIPGGQPMTLSGPFSFTDGPAGSAGAISMDSGGTATARVTGSTATTWRVSWWLEVPEDFDADTDYGIMVNWLTPGATSFNQWFAYVAPSQGGKIAMDGFDFGTNEFAIEGAVDLRGRGPVLVEANASTVDASHIKWSLNVYGSDFTDPTSVLSIAGTLAPITSVGINGYQAANDNPATKGTVSHLTVANKPSSFDAGKLLPAGVGYAGERATERVRRMANETGIPLVVVDDDGASEPMGPQPIAAPLDVLRDVEATDGGVLYEQRDGRLAYQPRNARYNATPVLRLDYGSKHVAPPLEPTDDDRLSRNDWTVSRDGGGSARVVDQDSIDAIGLYDDSATLNVDTDDQLDDQAGWRVHLGTDDGLRYPAITPNLLGTPELIPDWIGTDIGDAAAITRPGRDLPPGQIDLFVEGYTETIDVTEWRATANCSPGAPWRVGVLDDDVLDRLGTAGSKLADDIAKTGTTTVVEDFEDAALSITITDAGDAGWARSDDDAHTGTWALKSGAITDAQTSDAVVTVPDDMEWCLFWYRVSSEPTFDFFKVLVDDTEKISESGETGWVRGAVPVSGASTVTFRYVKDAATLMFGDAAWVDDLLFSTTMDISVATTSGPLWTIDSDDMPIDVTIAGEDMAFTAVAAPTVADPLNSNTGFEDGSTGWTGTGGTFTTVTSPVHEGTKAGKITPDGTSAIVFVESDQITATPGTVYTASAWLQCATARDVEVFVSFFDASDALIVVARGAIIVAANSWGIASRDFTAPAGTDHLTVGGAMFDTPTTSDVMIMDEITVRTTTDPSSPQTATVIRSINGVVKAHDAGEAVRLTQPMILSL